MYIFVHIHVYASSRIRSLLCIIIPFQYPSASSVSRCIVLHYLYTPHLALSLCHISYFGKYLCLLFGNISTPLLCGSISMPLIWQYLYHSSMVISLCLFFGNISLPVLWQYLYASSFGNIFLLLAISLCFCEQYLCFCEQYLATSASNISLLLPSISLCFCEQNLFPFASSISPSGSNISLLLRATSLCFCEQYLLSLLPYLFF